MPDELRDLFTAAFGAASSVPAEPELTPSIEATGRWTFAPRRGRPRAERLPVMVSGRSLTKTPGECDDSPVRRIVRHLESTAG